MKKKHMFDSLIFIVLMKLQNIEFVKVQVIQLIYRWQYAKNIKRTKLL